MSQMVCEGPLLQKLKSGPGGIYGSLVVAQIPRILGQIDRNQHSPTYGSCCRNFWHYRIEDISNSQAQEVVLTLAVVYKCEAEWNHYTNCSQLLQWIEAILHFWVRIQRPRGSFDEVYHGQDSYAATAFSSYCVSEALLLLKPELSSKIVEQVERALLKSVAWLNKTEELLACNQIAGAAAAVFNCYLLTDSDQSKALSRRLVKKLQDLQNPEGWFNEYGGADIGYSSLTLDYLVKLWERSGWVECFEMAERLLEFLSYFIHKDGTAGGIYGSRNTEYVIPHGIELLVPHIPLAQRISNRLLTSIFERPDLAVLNRLDDRYLLYLSGFFAQAAVSAIPREQISNSTPCTEEHEKQFSDSGLISIANNKYHLTVNVKKGGVFRCDFHEGGSFQDCGIFVSDENRSFYSTQVLRMNEEIQTEKESINMKTAVVKIEHILVSPWKCLIFKTFNLLVPAVLRKVVLGFLRKVAVSGGKVLCHGERRIDIEDCSVHVSDTLTLSGGRFEVREALHTERTFSFASSGFFHPAELMPEFPYSIPRTVVGPCQIELSRDLHSRGWSNLKSVIETGLNRDGKL